MVDPTAHPDFDLDTALSADLDGELDGYASDLGLPVDDVRAALAGPTTVARRAALVAARDALRDDPGAPVPLDDVTRRRLLAGAGVGSAARSAPRRDRGRLLRAAAAAAITLLVLGGLYAILHDSGGSGGSVDQPRSPGPGVAGSPPSPCAGTSATSARSTRARSRASSGAGSPGDAAGTAPNADRAASSADSSFAAANPRAVDGCVNQYASEGSIRFRGSGSYQGRPAVVLGIDTGPRTIVFVVAADDCARVLYSASR